MRNKYGVYNFESESEFGFNWLGATVSFVLFGKRRVGKVCGCNRVFKLLTAEFYDGTKRVMVEAPYQAYRKED